MSTTVELTGNELLDLIDSAIESNNSLVDAFTVEELVETAEMVKEVIA